jgi:phosphoribosylformylglycinamidine cyclo-ligase
LIGLPSSGLHSNGYSLARKVLLERARLNIGRRVAELGRTLAEELLEPTRIYVRVVRKLFAAGYIKGAAHITGGGITGNLPRVLPKGRAAIIARGSWPVPPVFPLIQKIGGVAEEVVDQTFNNGLGMILVVGKRRADRVLAALKKMHEAAFVIGDIRNGPRDATIRS